MKVREIEGNHNGGVGLPFDSSSLRHVVAFCPGVARGCVWFWGRVYVVREGVCPCK